MIHQMVAAININIDPDLIDGRLSLTWHGLFTAVGIALGVWLALRLARRTDITADDAMNIALVAVPSGIVGARLLWVLEHTDQIRDVSDVFAVTDGGISVYGAMIGGVVGGFLYLVWFKPEFPKWVALDIAAPGMILGQAVGRFGDFVNGEHFAKVTDLPWGFRYTHPSTEGPWAVITDGNIPRLRGVVSRPDRAAGGGAGDSASGGGRLRTHSGLAAAGFSALAVVERPRAARLDLRELRGGLRLDPWPAGAPAHRRARHYL